MKKEKLLRSMELIDDKYIEEAATVKKAFPWRSLVAIAACLCCIIAASAWLFLPVDENSAPIDAQIAQFSDSEYFPVIQKLHAYNDNEYLRQFATNSSTDSGDEAFFPDVGDSGVSGVANYQETTDNQVEGVIEPDLIKRNDKYIYYLDNGNLRIFTIDKENSQEVASHYIPWMTDQGSRPLAQDMYLSADGETLTAIFYCASPYRDYHHTSVLTLDVQNPQKLVEKSYVRIEGRYLTSRMTNGKLLVFTQASPRYQYNFADLDSFIPKIDLGDGLQYIPADKFICPNAVSAKTYTIACMMEADTLAMMDIAAILSGSEQIYVSKNNIYTTRTWTEPTNLNETLTNWETKTDIFRLEYTDRLQYKGCVTVKGYANNQYSFDEYNGYLRLVTTTQNRISIRVHDSAGWYPPTTSASLYCFDLNGWQTAAKIENFAPINETVRSVRFDKDAAYVCTAVQLTDPVFFFDLSDMRNISYTDTGTIPGFSTSLIQLGDGYLLGVGPGEEESVKVEIYQESNGQIISVCKYEQPEALYSQEYKAYLIDREKKLFGFGLTSYNNPINRYEHYYILLQFADDTLTEVLKVASATGASDSTRAVLIDGYLYLFSREVFHILPVTIS